MTFGYVSSKNHVLSVEEQRLSIENWCREKNIQLEKVIENDEIKSVLHNGDAVVVENIGVLGKSVKFVLEEISVLLSEDITIYAINWDQPVKGKEMARAFSVTLETFNSIVVNSTKVGLKQAKTEGRIGGRKPGQKPSKTKLTGHREKILEMLSQGLSKSFIARQFHVSWNTVDLFIRERLHENQEEKLSEQVPQ